MIKFLLPIFLLVSTFAYAQDDTEQDSCVIFSLTEFDVTVGDSACTFITVSNFENLLSFQFSLQYDDTVLEYGDCTADDLIAGFGCGDLNLQEDGPIFKSLWFEPLGNLVSLEDETPIVNLCFLVIAEPTSDEPLIQFTDDLIGEATKGDPNDVRVAEKFPFCSQDDITSNVLDIKENRSLAIYPNPVIDKLFVQNDDENITIEQISIYSVNGQLMVKENQLKNINEMQLDNLRQGYYFVKIEMSDNTRYSSRFYKE